MLTAITHSPSPALTQCELTYLARRVIDPEMTASQHEQYNDMLRRCGVQVLTYDDNISLPDSVFVEDAALVLDEIGIMMSMGAETRRSEVQFIESLLVKYRQVKHISLPAQLEGGDILQIGKNLYVGLSSRSNRQGVEILEQIVRPYGYRVTGVEVSGCLHLKTGVTALDDDTLLINPKWVDPGPFDNMKQLAVPEEEPFAANILQINGTICLHSGFTQTRELLEKRGYQVDTTDISEFHKAEAGLTCMSLIFQDV